MTKVFLCHASEDEPIVEHIYASLIETYKDIELWLDKFEILGGESLTEKIGEGINKADKFVIFLSSTSIIKPWVNKELRKAIIEEISRGGETFIIPVLLGKIHKIPDFLEDKLYLDITQMTESEFLKILYSSVKGMREGVSTRKVQNLQIRIARQNKMMEVHLIPQYWAEDIAFEIEINKPYKTVLFGFSKSGTAMAASVCEEKAEKIYRICLPDKRITPDNFFIVHFDFENAAEDINVVRIEKWSEGFRKSRNFVIKT